MTDEPTYEPAVAAGVRYATGRHDPVEALLDQILAVDLDTLADETPAYQAGFLRATIDRLATEAARLKDPAARTPTVY